MTYKDLNNKTAKDLQEMDKKLREELFHLKLKHSTGQLEKKSQIRLVRLDIARVKTRLSALKNESGRASA